MSEEFNAFVRDMERQIESTRRSEMLTADDFAVTINARADDFLPPGLWDRIREMERREREGRLRKQGYDIVPLADYERLNR